MRLDAVAVTLLVVGFASAAAGQSSPSTAVILDDKQEALSLVDARTGEVRGRISMHSGHIYQPKERSRLVVFSKDSVSTAVASVVERDPLRLVSTVSLGRLCHLPFVEVDERLYGEGTSRFGVLESADGRRLSVLCWGKLVNLDLITGGLSTLPLPEAETSVNVLPDDRAVFVACSDPGCEVLLVDLATLHVIGQVHIDGNVHLMQGVVSPDRRSIVFLKNSDYSVKTPRPSELLYFDIGSWRLPKTLTLSAAFWSSELSRRPGFMYLSNLRDERLSKGTAPVVEIVSLSDGSVRERIPLGRNAHWIHERISPERSPHLVLDAPGTPQGRLLVLDGDRVTSVPLPGAQSIAVIPDQAGSRLFLAAGRSLFEYRLPELDRIREIPLGRQIGTIDMDRFIPSEDCTRILWIRGNEVRVVNTQTATVGPQITIGTTGRKARQLVGEVAVSALATVFNEPLGGTSVSPAAAFRTDAKQAYVRASTGELATIDLDTGRVLGHRDAAGRLVSTPRLLLAVAPHSVGVTDRATGADLLSLGLEGTSGAIVTVSRDLSRILVGVGTSVHILDATTGKPIAVAKGFGRVAAARFLD